MFSYDTSSFFPYNPYTDNSDAPTMSPYELLFHQELYQSMPSAMIQPETFVCPADVYRNDQEDLGYGLSPQEEIPTFNWNTFSVPQECCDFSSPSTSIYCGSPPPEIKFDDFEQQSPSSPSSSSSDEEPMNTTSRRSSLSLSPRKKRAGKNAKTRDTIKRLLRNLRSDKKMAWKEIAKWVEKETGEIHNVPALQMRLKRMEDRGEAPPKL